MTMQDELPSQQRQGQQQSQQQTQTIFLNLRNSSDPQLEAHIFGELYSAGSQIGCLANVLEHVLASLKDAPVWQTKEGQAAVKEFSEMQRAIREAKEARKPAQAIISELESIRQKDQEKFSESVTALRDYLARVN